VSEPGTQPAIAVAGWSVTLVDLGAIHAPRSATIVACSHVDGFGRIERAGDGAGWIDVG